MTLLLKVAALAVPVLAMAAVNYTVDPAMVFHPREPAIADMLLAGQAVTDVVNFDERSLQRLLIERRTAAPEVAVFGSSRTREVRGGFIGAAAFANHSVPRASIEDFIALAGAYEVRGLRPRHIAIAIDPWTLNARGSNPHWQAWGSSYRAYARAVGAEDDAWLPALWPFKRRAQLVSPTYLQSALRALLAGGAPRAQPLTAAGEGREMTILPDGSRRYTARYLARTPEQASAYAEIYIAAPIAGLQRFTEVSESRMRSLERLVVELRSRGVGVSLALLPFHPVAYASLMRAPAYPAFRDVEASVRALAQRTGVRMLGSHDPAAVGCTAGEFHDGVHPRERCLEKLFAPLASR